MKGMCSLKKKIHAKTILSVLAGIIAGIAIFAGGCIYRSRYMLYAIRIQQLI